MTPKEINIMLEIHGTTLNSVSKELDVNYQFLSNIINKTRNFKQPAVRRVAILFARRFNLKVEYVFDGAEPATKEEIEEANKQLRHLDFATTTTTTTN